MGRTIGDAYRRPSVGACLDGTVRRAPASADVMLDVELDRHPGISHSVPWMPRPERLPLPGDAVLVVETAEGELWAACWWPQT